ncbi:hypothetical protein M0804_014998 [Polistes exclamans]|nr:hypothetical protein M0804_014998 [Polistes exclamans]
MEIDVDLSTPTRIVNGTTAQDKDCDRNRFAGPAEVAGVNLNHARGAQDLLIQRMRECGAGIAVIAEPCWVPPSDEIWFSSLGGALLSAVLVGESGRPCSLVHRSNFFLAVKLLDELEELLGRFPTSPVLVASDFNARARRCDPKSRSNLRGVRSLSRPGKTFPRWNARAADEDMLAAALISGDWTGPSCECSARVFVRWLRGMLVRVCDMALQRAVNTRDRRRKACWWSQELSALRAEATAARRRFLKARRSRDQRRMELCLEARRKTKKQLKSAIRKAKAIAWRDFVGTLKADPWGGPYRLVMGKLRPYLAPLTEVLEPGVMDRVLGGLFPQVERNIDGDSRGVQVDGAAVTLEEVLAAARKIAGEKAPGPDGVPGIVIKAAAGCYRSQSQVPGRGVRL